MSIVSIFEPVNNQRWDRFVFFWNRTEIESVRFETKPVLPLLITKPWLLLPGHLLPDTLSRTTLPPATFSFQRPLFRTTSNQKQVIKALKSNKDHSYSSPSFASLSPESPPTPSLGSHPHYPLIISMSLEQLSSGSKCRGSNNRVTDFIEWGKQEKLN